jgi:predicted permease
LYAPTRVFGQFVIKLALPCLLFYALRKRDISDILNASCRVASGLSQWCCPL